MAYVVVEVWGVRKGREREHDTRTATALMRTIGVALIIRRAVDVFISLYIYMCVCDNDLA